jgi:hypothetical protein
MRAHASLCGLIASLALTGCMTVPPTPKAMPADGTRAAPQPATAPSAAQSEALRAYYAQVQASLLAQGLLRGDGGGPDTPFDADTLVRNFQTIALFEEYATVGGRIVARQTASRLHRWDMPVRINVEFGGAIPLDAQLRDRHAIERYATRLSRVMDHPVSVTDGIANFHVFVVDERARRALGPRLREIIPVIDAASISAVTDLPRSSYCLVFAWDPGDDGTYAKAVAVIRAEHPDMMRLSCIHEEIAQGMGLSNDSPKARPSIFNDDEEFGLLTSHDEVLLSILYDPRLRPGMTAEEALPIVRRIAAEKMGGPS